MSFALSKDFEEVVGIDFSQAFVDAANVMKMTRRAKYRARVEADIFDDFVCEIPVTAKPDRVFFAQGDACALPPADQLGASPGGRQFDAVLACNLLCRLPDPRSFLRSLPDLVTQGGVAVLVSPYSWLEQWTPKEKWIGGTVDKSGKVTRSFDALRVEMEKDGLFELVKEGDMPFLIREHCRKFQWGCSHLTVWRRMPSPAAKEVSSGGYSR
jgi:putative 4-mercaptohistidine N1-methyltranferase